MLKVLTVVPSEVTFCQSKVYVPSQPIKLALATPSAAIQLAGVISEAFTTGGFVQVLHKNKSSINTVPP